MIPAGENRIFGLDLLRAIAIVMVLLAHTWPSKAHTEWARALAVLGVELFFVLSGFLVGRILLRVDLQSGRWTWSQLVTFWSRRWLRTLPNYYLFLLLHIVWRASVLGFPDVLQTNWRYFFFLQNLWQPPGFFFADSWSLSIEEWFYLAFPLCLWLVRRVIPSRRIGWTLVIALFVLGPSILRLTDLFPIDPWREKLSVEVRRAEWEDDPRKIVGLRLDVVMYGVLAACLSVWRPNAWVHLRRYWPLGVALCLMAFMSVILGWPLDPAEPLEGWLLWPLIASNIAVLLPFFAAIIGAWRFGGTVVTAVARISYSLYLCHGLVLLVLGRWCRPDSVFPLRKNTLEWAVVAWVVALLVSAVVYRWFEKPLTDLRSKVRLSACESSGHSIPVVQK